MSRGYSGQENTHAVVVQKQCPHIQVARPLDMHLHTAWKSRVLWGPEAVSRARMRLRLVLMTVTPAAEKAAARALKRKDSIGRGNS